MRSERAGHSRRIPRLAAAHRRGEMEHPDHFMTSFADDAVRAEAMAAGEMLYRKRSTHKHDSG